LGGSLVGTGLVTVANVQNIVNSATISPGFSPGELDIAGNYQQTASGVLNIDLGGLVPGTGFDLITVTAGGAGGVATLGGTLNVTLINGFSPGKGATFTFLTAASRVGAFATFNYPSNDIGMQLSTDATSAKVTVSNLKPVVANPIGNPAPGTNGAAFNFQFPANAFSDPDGDTLTYSASGMPAGITFTGATRTFSGTPTQAGIFSVAVAATDIGCSMLDVRCSMLRSFGLRILPQLAGLRAAATLPESGRGNNGEMMNYETEHPTSNIQHPTSNIQ
jgi:Putative Ig domain